MPAGDRGPAADVGVLRGEQGGVRGLRGHDAAGRGAVDRRGVPRRARAAADLGHAARRSPCGCGAGCCEQVGLPITVGVARTKFLAKVASGVAKPDGLLVVPPDGELAFLHPLPVERLWGVGPVTAEKLRARGITTVGQVAQLAETDARRRCSAARPAATSTRSRTTAIRGGCRSAGAGARSGRSARSAAAAGRPRRSTPSSSGSSTASARRLRAARRVCRTVMLRLRFDDFSRATRSHTLTEATAQTAGDPRHRARAARGGDADDRAPGAHAVGLTLGNLEDDGAVQLALPFDARRASGARRHDRPRRATATGPPRSRGPCCSAATRASPCRCCPTDALEHFGPQLSPWWYGRARHRTRTRAHRRRRARAAPAQGSTVLQALPGRRGRPRADRLAARRGRPTRRRRRRRRRAVRAGARSARITRMPTSCSSPSTRAAAPGAAPARRSRRGRSAAG